jgi:predicted ArsR family transcriptional regulator
MANPTRDIILRTLRVRGKCTVKDLAEAAAVSPVSVRHHLTNLQAEGLVQAEEVRHGVGRPRLLYFLTDTALELFPARYFSLSSRLIDEIKEMLPENQVAQVFNGVAEAMAQRYAGELAGLPMDRRLGRLVELLGAEGFEAQIERQGDQIIVRELSCPYFRIGQEHPEVCSIDHTLIARALSVPVDRVTCLLDGDIHCSFVAQIQPHPGEMPS